MTTVNRDASYTTVMHDLEDFLDERGLGYEVIDGAIVVNARPTWDHQDCLTELLFALRGAIPEGLAVMSAGLRFFYEPASYLEPDVVVCRRSDRLHRVYRPTGSWIPTPVSSAS
jgi:Uma2 family endonuclease